MPKENSSEANFTPPVTDKIEIILEVNLLYERLDLSKKWPNLNQFRLNFGIEMLK